MIPVYYQHNLVIASAISGVSQFPATVSDIKSNKHITAGWSMLKQLRQDQAMTK
jgi:hypothetical protein